MQIDDSDTLQTHHGLSSAHAGFNGGDFQSGREQSAEVFALSFL
jgi:hypothetical protein